MEAPGLHSAIYLAIYIIHAVIFCFPPPTLTTPRNLSLTPNFWAFRRLCSDDKDFETKSLEMRTIFVKRGYLIHLLDSAIQKAFNNSRRDTLKPTLGKISDDKIPLVLTFHPFNYKVRDIISRNFQILKNDPETSAIFTDNPIISFRRNKNMRDNLVRSSLEQNLRAPAGTFSCSRARCYTYSFLNSATSISGPKSNFAIRHNFHAPPPTSFTAFLAVNVANFISVKRAGVYLTDLMNTFASGLPLKHFLFWYYYPGIKFQNVYKVYSIYILYIYIYIYMYIYIYIYC